MPAVRLPCSSGRGKRAHPVPPSSMPAAAHPCPPLPDAALPDAAPRRPTVKKDQFLLVWKKRLSHIKTSESAERARPYEVREGDQTAGAS